MCYRCGVRICSVAHVFSELGYSPPDELTRGREKWNRHSSKHVFRPAKVIEIVSDKSKVDEIHLHVDEPLIACSNRGQNVEFELVNNAEIVNDDKCADVLGIDDEIAVVFHRTVRMPDDDRLHSLPASLGTFPLYNVADYADRLPNNIIEKGGVFLPMWQREALWISFHPKSMRAYAIRVYIGHINAVTGSSMMENGPTTDGDRSLQQDYIIVPGQSWIDGICVSPGVVRQFVAMPCKRSVQ